MITFDHRGFSRSKEIPEGPDRADFVEDLHGLLNRLNLGEAALVAQSMGGIARRSPSGWCRCFLPEGIASV